MKYVFEVTRRTGSDTELWGRFHTAREGLQAFVDAMPAPVGETIRLDLCEPLDDEGSVMVLETIIDSESWIALCGRVLGAAGGAKTSDRKAKAARENGKKGGRPKTQVYRVIWGTSPTEGTDRASLP